MDGRADRACRVLKTSAWHAPTRVDTHHALTRLYSQAKRFDRAFQACAPLVHLGDADLDEQMLYHQYVPDTGLRPTGAMELGEEASELQAAHETITPSMDERRAPMLTG